MNPLFATWHREVSLNLAGIDIGAREGAANSIAKAASSSEVLRLVALAFGMEADDAADAWLRRPFQQAEPSFAMRGNDVEMQILAAAILEEICRASDAPLRVLAAYAVTVAQFRGFTCPVAEVAEASKAARVELAESRRQLAPRPVIERVTVIDNALKESIEEHSSSSDVDALQNLFLDLATAMQKGVDALQGHTESVVAWAEGNTRLAGEDTRLLWWLLSGRSTTLNQPWSSLPTHVLAVIAARELAATSVTVPAPSRSEALLQQLITVNGEPDAAERVPIPPLEVPSAMEFLISEIPENADHLEVACHALAQAMLLRAWADLA